MQKILAFIGLVIGAIVALFLSRNRDNNSGRIDADIKRVDDIRRINSEIASGINRAQDDAGDARYAIDRAQSLVDAIKKRNGITDAKP